jgi:hypothetical protein
MHREFPRLFFGLETHHDWLSVVGLNAQAEIVLRAQFPWPDPHRVELDDEETGSGAIAATLQAFVRCFGAEPICGTDHMPPVLRALAERLSGQSGLIRYVDLCQLERTAPLGLDPYVRREPGCVAHQRALLAAVAMADPGAGLLLRRADGPL